VFTDPLYFVWMYDGLLGEAVPEIAALVASDRNADYLPSRMCAIVMSDLASYQSWAKPQTSVTV